MAADKPTGDGVIELVKMAEKEMVGVINNGQLIFTGQRGNQFGHFALGAVLIIGAVDKEFGFRAAPKICEIRVVDGNAKANQIGNTRISAADAKAHPTAETETGEKQGEVGELRSKKMEGGLDVALLTQTAVV